jgi:glycosyltransferase involved in cell wall biosynthesis
VISAQAWLLDLTRLVSRLGRGTLTGIDRVELAYLQHLLARREPLFGLVRTALGFVVLDRAGARGVLDRVLGHVPLGPPDLLGLMTQRHLPQGLRAEADMRRLALVRCVAVRLEARLRRVLPPYTAYVNVGHANLSPRVMQAVKSVQGGQVVVMVHDTIPLDYPQFCRPGMAAGFATKLAVVAEYADLVVHTAHCTRAQTEAHFVKLLPGVVAPLGVEIASSDTLSLGTAKPPYFVALGTIEPRKNIGLLMQVWRELQSGAGPVPHLFVVGNRGWADQSLFDELEAMVAGGNVTVLHNLGDGAVTALLQGSEALLFPSLAEGYGLPPLEAAALGVPVMAGHLSVVVETLGDYPVYLDTSDVYAWVEAINHQMGNRTQQLDAQRQTRVPPSWADHFDHVFCQA